MGTPHFCLKSNNHQTNMLAVFEQFLESEALVDVTLACEGLSLKAHKVVLSACSPFFQSLFFENPCKHPIVILKDMKYKDLKTIIDFMYRGEVNVPYEQLSALLQVTEALKVKGLGEVIGEQSSGLSNKVQGEITSQKGTETVHSNSTQQQHMIESSQLKRKKRSRSERRRRRNSNCIYREEHKPSKIKKPDYLEIVEISKDTTHCSDVRQISNQSLIPHQTSHSARNDKPISSLSSVQDTCMTVEEPPSSDQTEYKMEQRLTDSVPVYSEAPAQGIMSPQVSNKLFISTAVEITDPHSHHATDSQSLICTIPSDPSVPRHINDNTIQNIKPLVLCEESTISPVTGPSYQDSNSLMLVDNSVSALPGSSGFQDQLQSQPQISQDNHQGHFIIPSVKKKKKKLRHSSLSLHKLPSKDETSATESEKIHKCPDCSQQFNHLNNMLVHLQVHQKEKTFICKSCGKQFKTQRSIKRHKRAHSNSKLKSHSKELHSEEVPCTGDVALSGDMPHAGDLRSDMPPSREVPCLGKTPHTGKVPLSKVSHSEEMPHVPTPDSESLWLSVFHT